MNKTEEQKQKGRSKLQHQQQQQHKWFGSNTKKFTTKD